MAERSLSLSLTICIQHFEYLPLLETEKERDLFHVICENLLTFSRHGVDIVHIGCFCDIWIGCNHVVVHSEARTCCCQKWAPNHFPFGDVCRPILKHNKFSAKNIETIAEQNYVDDNLWMRLYLCHIRPSFRYHSSSPNVSQFSIVFNLVNVPRSFHRYYMSPQTGQTIFFYPHSGSQFVAEGFIIGALNVLCAASLVCLVAFVPRVRASQRSMALIACLATFAFCFTKIQGFYQMKNQWY